MAAALTVEVSALAAATAAAAAVLAEADEIDSSVNCDDAADVESAGRERQTPHAAELIMPLRMADWTAAVAHAGVRVERCGGNGSAGSELE